MCCNCSSGNRRKRRKTTTSRWPSTHTRRCWKCLAFLRPEAPESRRRRQPGDVRAVRIDLPGLGIGGEEHTALETVMLGHNSRQGGQCFFAAVFLIAGDKDNMLAFARAAVALKNNLACVLFGSEAARKGKHRNHRQRYDSGSGHLLSPFDSCGSAMGPPLKAIAHWGGHCTATAYGCADLCRGRGNACRRHRLPTHHSFLVPTKNILPAATAGDA